MRSSSRAISRVVTAIIVIVIVIVGGIGAYLLSSSTKSSQTTSQMTSQTSSQSSLQTTTQSSSLGTTQSSSQSASLSSSQTTSQTTTQTGSIISTLTIDEPFWSAQDLNALYEPASWPYPDWQMYDVYQSLIDLNASALYSPTGASGISNLDLLPMLASNWTVSADGSTYTFNLRPNVTFSDGNPFNAYQVWAQMYGLYYLSANSTYWFTGYPLFDMSPVRFGPASISLLNQSGVIHPSQNVLAMMENTSWPIYVQGPYVISFRTAHPEQWFPLTLVASTGLIYDVQWLLQHGGWGTPTQYNTYFNQHPIPGTGPYVVTQVSLNSFIDFTKNPTYWGRTLTSAQISENPYLDPGHVQNVVIQISTDDLARYTDLSSGRAQISSIMGQDWALVQANLGKYSYVTLPSKASIFVGIGLNTLRYPTNITAVRQAIAHAINYSDVNSKAFLGNLVPTVPPEYSAFSQYYDLGNLTPYTYNVTLAKQILANASIDPSTLPALQFVLPAGYAPGILAAQIVQGDLAAIGLSVNIVIVPYSNYAPPMVGFGSYSTNLQDNQTIANIQAVGGSTWAPDEPTPAENWLLFVSNGSLYGNFAIYSRPDVQACVNAWTDGSNTSRIIAICTKAQAQIYNDVPYIFYGTPTTVWGAGSVVFDKTIVKGFYMDPCFSARSTTAIFNTVTFVNGQ